MEMGRTLDCMVWVSGSDWCNTAALLLSTSCKYMQISPWWWALAHVAPKCCQVEVLWECPLCVLRAIHSCQAKAALIGGNPLQACCLLSRLYHPGVTTLKQGEEAEVILSSEGMERGLPSAWQEGALRKWPPVVGGSCGCHHFDNTRPSWDNVSFIFLSLRSFSFSSSTSSRAALAFGSSSGKPNVLLETFLSSNVFNRIAVVIDLYWFTALMLVLLLSYSAPEQHVSTWLPRSLWRRTDWTRSLTQIQTVAPMALCCLCCVHFNNFHEVHKLT